MAYDHASEGLGEQARVLEDFRRRAGFLTAIGSGIATFLGGASLSEPTSEGWLNILAVIPLGVFGLGLWTSVKAVLPTRDPPGALQFVAIAKAILELPATSATDVRRRVAIELEEMWDKNKPVLDAIGIALTKAGQLLIWQVLLWSALLVTKEMT